MSSVSFSPTSSTEDANRASGSFQATAYPQRSDSDHWSIESVRQIAITHLANESDEVLREIGALSVYGSVSVGFGGRTWTGTSQNSTIHHLHLQLVDRLSKLTELTGSDDAPALPDGPDPQPVNTSLLALMRRTSSREESDMSAWYASMNDDWE